MTDGCYGDSVEAWHHIEDDQSLSAVCVTGPVLWSHDCTCVYSVVRVHQCASRSMSTVIESKRRAVMDGQLQGSSGAVWGMTHPELLSHESTEEAGNVTEQLNSSHSLSNTRSLTRAHTHTRAPTHAMFPNAVGLTESITAQWRKPRDARLSLGCFMTLTFHIIRWEKKKKRDKVCCRKEKVKRREEKNEMKLWTIRRRCDECT